MSQDKFLMRWRCREEIMRCLIMGWCESYNWVGLGERSRGEAGRYVVSLLGVSSSADVLIPSEGELRSFNIEELPMGEMVQLVLNEVVAEISVAMLQRKWTHSKGSLPCYVSASFSICNVLLVPSLLS